MASTVLYFCPSGGSREPSSPRESALTTPVPETNIIVSLTLKLMLGVDGEAHVTSSFTSPMLHPRFRTQNNTLNQ